LSWTLATALGTFYSVSEWEIGGERCLETPSAKVPSPAEFIVRRSGDNRGTWSLWERSEAKKTAATSNIKFKIVSSNIASPQSRRRKTEMLLTQLRLGELNHRNV